MGANDAVTLGALVGRLDPFEGRCRRCERHDRLRLARLIADHGAGTGLTDPVGRCFAHFPQLLELA